MAFSIWPPSDEWSGNALDAIEAEIFASLFSDARVSFEELDRGDTEQRGWWGDSFPEVKNDVWGSKFWLAERAKLTSDPNISGVNLATMRKWAQEALQHMIDDGVIVSLEIETERVGNEARLGITTVRTRGDDPKTRFFDALWTEKFGA